MSKPESCIKRLVDHNGGPVALSTKLGGRPVHQEIARWVARGWASPHHIFTLEPFLPPGMKVRDLADDKDRAKNPKPKGRAKPSPPAAKPASAAGAPVLPAPTSANRPTAMRRCCAKR